MNEKDFIFYKDTKNNICSGGYKIDNIFKKLDLPPLTQHAGKTLPNMVIPVGLFCFKEEKIDNDDINIQTVQGCKDIDCDVFEKLLALSLKPKEKPRTKKQRKKSKKGTRKKKFR
jgi:hypothetical protein|tara:strand:- start:135 stop:479 length:345 start_codon:yes stop_codon:yes gene_type:complete